MKQLLTFFLAAFCFWGAVSGITACRRDNSSSMAGEDNDFRVKDTSGVTRIFIADRNNNTVKLDRIGKGAWRLNDKYSARTDIVESILATLYELRVRYAVNESARAGIEREMATRGIKVEVYEGTEKKVFYVGGETPDQMGTHMYMEGAKRIYVTHIANWEGVLTSRFVSEEAVLRSPQFFDATNLVEIAVEYPTKREHSFRLLTQGTPRVEPFYVSTPASTKPLQTQLVRSYLDNIPLVLAASFINDSPIRDSTVATVPFCKITLRNTKNELQHLDFFPARGRQVEGTEDQYGQMERYFCWYANAKNEKEFILTNIAQSKHLMWSYTSFFNDLKQLPKSRAKPEERRYK